MRFLTGRATSREEIEGAVLPGMLAVYERHPGLGTFAAHEKASGRFVGWFGLQPTGRAGTQPVGEGFHAVVDVGYRLSREVWGKGYATEGTRALIDKAFGELGVERVVADTMAVNTKSRRVMVKSGLRFVRVFHVEFDDPLPGSEHGEVEYAIDRASWLAGQRV